LFVLTNQVPRYDPVKLANKLAQKCSVKRNGCRNFDWRSFGRESGVCFNTVPDNVCFLAGYLDQPVEAKKRQVRKQRTKEVVDESKEEEPEAIMKNKSDADQLSAAEKNLKQMRKVLKDRARESTHNNKNEIDGVNFLFNPKSFTQTVENLFNFSFLIKKGDAEIGVNDNTGLFVRPRSAPNDGEPVVTTQAVVSFTMRDWQRIVAQRNLMDGDLPHRTGSKHTRVMS
jgi:non-structural maintenance of chromosomes element 4